MKIYTRSAIALLAVGTVGILPCERVASAADPAPVATVIEVQGPVSWRPREETQLREAHGGEQLFAGAVLRTGVRGNARLSWRVGGDFRLLPLSELAIPDDEGVLLNAGKVWAQFHQKLLAPFYFKSPSATAVVRGTTLAVEIGPEGATTVDVLEGRVEVSDAHGGASRMLQPGQSLTVSPFGQFGPIQPVAPGGRLFDRGFPGGPGRDPERDRPRPFRPDGAVDWLQRNRAAVRLDLVRQQERDRPPERDFRMGPGHGPDRAFSAGRPGGPGPGPGPGRPMPPAFCEPPPGPLPPNPIAMPECLPQTPPPPPDRGPGGGR